ncbi:hypothetical protein BAU15_06410 [Enterococcus sp. JM4C]|uniref:MurR/RpiR family transcriptional regulator n=1 Tax=Candidatus Enterococcus huntleyi TaxID=1857217 RepID=UPI00137B32B5|nr:MurR/RpiR family transcriptional regulator [Enterococcus sp. JM4C]KAF1297177.1 hypothetical protein BAU15_06410 [Enterococcus sp. JM4C]
MLLEKRMKLAQLTKVEKSIAEYIMTHKNDLEKLSTRMIANATHTSSSAVIRLAHKLGFAGYKELKAHYIQEMAYLQSHFQSIDANIPFTETDTIMSVAHIMKQMMIESANDTSSLIRHDSLQQALNLLEKAAHIYIFAYSSYLPLAQVFQVKMARIKKQVIVQNMIGEANYQANLITKEDCAIIISYSGENPYLIKTTKSLKRKGISVIGITSVGENSLREFSDCVLDISTREKLFSKIGNFSSEYSVELILNILYSCYFQLNYEKNRSYKVLQAKKIENNHFLNNDLLND